MFRERVSSRGREVAAKVARMAQEHGMTGAQLALLWCKNQPGITVAYFHNSNESMKARIRD